MGNRFTAPAWAFLAVPLCALALARGLWAPDEPRYAQIAKEAFESSSFLVLHLNGELYPDKPPLVYWLAGASGAVFDWAEIALRAPSIVATLGSAWLTASLARRWLGDEEARVAPLFFLGCAMSLWMGSRLQLDPVLGFFVLAAVERLARDGDERELRAHSAWAGLWAGLGALAKGPVAWVPIALALVAWRVVPRSARFAPRRGALAWTLLVALAMVPVALWAALASWKEPALARALFFGQHLGRVSEEAPHAGPPWEHLIQMPLWLAPTTLLVAAGLALAWRGFRAARAGDGSEAGAVRIALWLVLVSVFFSAIPPKRELYLLPVYPAAALLAARAFAQGLRAGALPAWVARGTPAVLAVFALALAVGPWLVDEARAFAPQCALIAVPLVLAALTALRTRDLERWARVQWLGVAATIVLACAFVVPAIDAIKSPRALAQAIAARPEKPTEVLFLGVQPEGYRFYAGVPGVKLGGEGRDVDDDVRAAMAREGREFLLVARARDLERLAPDLRARLKELSRARVGSRDVLVLGAG